jgi:hypothetical protein
MNLYPYLQHLLSDWGGIRYKELHYDDEYCICYFRENQGRNGNLFCYEHKKLHLRVHSERVDILKVKTAFTKPVC